ncbi:MAG TPA: c-type cytochrome, partial [Candidatus Xenobia bacterium]
SALCPDQHGLATRAATRVPNMTAEAYIRKTIETPNWFQVPNPQTPGASYQPIMPPLRSKMTDQDFEDVVAYLMTLK